MKSFCITLSLLALSLTFFGATEEGKDGVVTTGLKPSEMAGLQLFTLKKCSDCHTLGEKADGKLTPVPNKRGDDWFAKHIEENSEIVLREEKSARRKRRVLRDEVQALSDFLYGAEAESRERIVELPGNILNGGYLVYQQNCQNCHTIAGQGKDAAPVLKGIPDKFDKKWLTANLKDPKQFSPETIMPPFDHLSEEEIDQLTDYLLTIK